MNSRSLIALPVAATCVLLAGCGSSSGASSPSQSKLKVVTSFYPLQYAVEQIGGSAVSASSLTPPGAEPHDLELTPQEVGSVSQAKLVVYADGFQSAVDDAVKSSGGTEALDVASAADLSLSLDSVTSIGSEDHSHDDHEHEHSHDHGSADPHFWLDPTRYAKVAEAIGAKLEKLDPAHATEYQKNTKAFVGQLNSLDADFKKTLGTCKVKDIVTSHAAFGYLAQRYNFTQIGVLGLAPDQEPTPGRLKDVAAFVKSHNVKTIYSETLASPAVAKTVAAQTGATVKVLDPIEGITDASAGKNYLEIMRANLATLQASQDCS